MHNRALPALAVTLLVVASCTQSTASPGAVSGGDGAAGVTGEGGGSGSGAMMGDGAGSGSGASSGSGSSGGAGVTGDGGGADSSDSGSTSSGGGGDGAAGSACTMASAACKASNSGCNVGSYYLYDNQWNCGGSTGNSCGPESAYGCTNGNGTVSWVVTSNQPAGNTAVLTYPAVQDNFNSKPLLSSFSTISATFEETSPHVGDYEVAWDCWFNNNANELMVWVDNYNQAPAGTKVGSSVPLGGRSYDIWWAPSTGTGGYVVFNAKTTFTSGTVDLLQLFSYATSHGWLPASSTVNQLSFGVEVCSTNGQNATWTVSNYSITAN